MEINSYYKTCQEYILLIYNRWGNLVFEQTLNSEMFSGSSNASSELPEEFTFIN
ncbi:MAG: gliding motility-associated C-terminal domain-containing protein [Bacteroidota bacterium]